MSAEPPVDAPPPGSPAGWYRAVDDPATERWWDGHAWTSVTRSTVDAMTDRAPAPAPPPTHESEPTVIAAHRHGADPPELPVSHQPDGKRSNMSTVVVATLAVVFAGAIGIGGAALLARSDEATSVATPNPTTTATPAPSTNTSTSTTETSEPECVDSFDSYLWPTTTVGPFVDCPHSPYGHPPMEEATLRGPYVAVLDSFRLENQHEAEGRYEDWASKGLNVVLVDSRTYLGLRDPYFVLVVDGYATVDDAKQLTDLYAGTYPRHAFDPDDPFTQPQQ